MPHAAPDKAKISRKQAPLGVARDDVVLREEDVERACGRNTDLRRQCARGRRPGVVELGEQRDGVERATLVQLELSDRFERHDPALGSRRCAHVRRLERLLIDVLARHGVDGIQVDGRSGVWVHRPLSTDKVAAIGVRVERGVTMHGFAVNCDNSLAPFRRIIPCGITDAGVTTVSEVTGVETSPRDILPTVTEVFLAAEQAVAA